ncbi:odorant receptor 49b-like [Pectinophora gossypiella]|uniref:odorant receptor 49b-like n=1 Tax=Pectinophora gossypiella TaxID=13191 RepID=UPI00214F3C7A|nr:odorant receptor 49b-like [Pectinophora gossypiella]
MASAIICVCIYFFTMEFRLEEYIFMVCYCIAMVGQIFVPGWFGSELKYQNSELVVAAYKSEWMPRSEKFKRNLKLFITRANTPLVLKGTQMFPLTLQTFISIIRMAYSLFALVRNVQDK